MQITNVGIATKEFVASIDGSTEEEIAEQNATMSEQANAQTQEQIDEMVENKDIEDFEVAEAREKEVRHDVMSHVYAYGKRCPKAEPIIDLVATSCYVGENTDILLLRDALKLILEKAIQVELNLTRFAIEYKDLPCLGYTHLQPAQLTTVCKRATLWINELLMDLDATPEQLDSPMLFCSARNGTASYSPDVVGTDLKPLFDTILDYIPAPEADLDQPFQMLVSAIDYNEFVGRIAIGRVERGVLKQNQEIAVCNYHDPDAPA